MTIISTNNCNIYTKDSYDKNVLTQIFAFPHTITFKKETSIRQSLVSFMNKNLNLNFPPGQQSNLFPLTSTKIWPLKYTIQSHCMSFVDKHAILIFLFLNENYSVPPEAEIFPLSTLSSVAVGSPSTLNNGDWGSITGGTMAGARSS
jgi:hypothetical protein